MKPLYESTGVLNAPHPPDGTETRREAIAAALWNARDFHPEFNVADLAGYIEGYLVLWEGKRAASEVSSA